MTKNVSAFDRSLRLLLGILLLGWAVAGGPWWGYVGVGLIASAAWGFCPLYWTVNR